MGLIAPYPTVLLSVYLFRHLIIASLSRLSRLSSEHPVSACTAGLSPLFQCDYFGCPGVCIRPHRIKRYYFPHYFGTAGIEPTYKRISGPLVLPLNYVPIACLSRLSQCIYSSFAALPYTATTSRSHLSRKWAGTGSRFAAFSRNLLHKVDPCRFLSSSRMVCQANRQLAQPKSPPERQESNLQTLIRGADNSACVYQFRHTPLVRRRAFGLNRRTVAVHYTWH